MELSANEQDGTLSEEDAAHSALAKLLEGRPPITLEIELPLALLLVGNLQLALRHPQNSGDGARAIRAFARDLQARIAPVGSEIHAVMEMGWEG